MLGGNASEKLIFGDTTTGSSNDIEKATTLARRMVTEFGMSEKLGPLAFGKRDELVFLGREIGEQRNYSDDVAKMIDEEVRVIIDRGYAKAMDVLVRYKDRLIQLAERLVAEETIEQEAFETDVRRHPRPAEGHAHDACPARWINACASRPRSRQLRRPAARPSRHPSPLNRPTDRSQPNRPTDPDSASRHTGFDGSACSLTSDARCVLLRRPSLSDLWRRWLADRTATGSPSWPCSPQPRKARSRTPWCGSSWRGWRRGAVLGFLGADAGSRLGRLGWPGLSLAKAAVAVVLVGGATSGYIRSVEVLLGLTAVLGFLSALSADARYATVRGAVGLQNLGLASTTASFVDRAAVLAGGVVATLMALTLPGGTISPIPAVFLWVLAAAIAFVAGRSIAVPTRTAGAEPSPGVSPDVARRIGVWLTAAFAGGAVGAALLIGSFALFSMRCLNYGPCDVIALNSAGPVLVAVTAARNAPWAGCRCRASSSACRRS